MSNEQNLCRICNYEGNCPVQELHEEANDNISACMGYEPKATEESNSSSMACSIAWSTKAPDTEGFYWLDAIGNGIRPQVVPVIFNKDAIRDGVSGYRFGFHLPGVAVEMVSSKARWAGPLTPPKQ